MGGRGAVGRGPRGGGEKSGGGDPPHNTHRRGGLEPEEVAAGLSRLGFGASPVDGGGGTPRGVASRSLVFLLAPPCWDHRCTPGGLLPPPTQTTTTTSFGASSDMMPPWLTATGTYVYSALANAHSGDNFAEVAAPRFHPIAWPHPRRIDS